MERLFFGDIDAKGHNAVLEYSDFKGISDGFINSFQHLALYVGAQRFRTPRGLDEIKRRATWEDASHNTILAALSRVFQAYSTMWTEGVWEIVRARQTSTKFIVTDNPVTFYCKAMFPSDWNYPEDCNLKQIGTRTLFPLGPETCLIITHLQLCRNPWNTPTEHRANARFYDQALKHVGDIQFGRELEEDEVRRINYILKTRATRFIAAAEEDWLYPERQLSTTEWRNLDDDWFLLPHLWKVPFTTRISVGYSDGGVWAADEYGRHPSNPNFEDKRMRERDHVMFDRAKKAWAKMRVGKSVAQTDEHRFGHVYDTMMSEYLKREGLLPQSDGNIAVN